MKASIVLLIATLAVAIAAPPVEQPKPVAPAAVPAQPDMLAPLGSQVRSLVGDSKKAIEVMEKAAEEAGNHIYEQARSALTNMGKEDRANLPVTLQEKAMEMGSQLREEAVKFLEKSLTALMPVKQDVRASVLGVRDLAKMVEKKYLTEDGQELVRSLLDATVKAAVGH